MTSRSLLAVALAAVLPACGGGPLVAPLRYEASPPLPEEPFRATPPDASPVPPSAPPPFRVSVLPNGLKVAVAERHELPVFAVRLISERGSADVGAATDASSILHRLLENGTMDRTPRELALAYARLGAPRRAFLTHDGCGLASRASAGDLDVSVSLLAESATRPRLSPRSLSDARTTWLQDFANGAYDARLSVMRNAMALLFGPEHPYGFARPARAHTDAIGVADLTALHAQLFHPAHVTLVVVGDVTPEAVVASATRWLGGWAPPAPPVPRGEPAILPARGPRLVFVERRRSTQVEGAVVALGPEAGSRDAAALEILGQVLAGGSSRLRGEVRVESGATYHLNAGLWTFRHASSFVVSSALDRDKAVPALRTILAALAEARTHGVRAPDLERARTSLLAAWRTQTASSEGLAALAENALSAGLPLQAVHDYPARIAAVTGADLQRAAQRWLAEDAVHVVVTGEAGVHDALADLGLGAPARHDVWGQPLRR